MWEYLYEYVCVRDVDILMSIDRLEAGAYKDGITETYDNYVIATRRIRLPDGTIGFQEIDKHCSIDELVFFTNVCAHLRQNMQVIILLYLLY